MINNNGIFIGLVNVPIGKEKPIKEIVDQIFSVYGHRLTEVRDKKDEYNQTLQKLYKPHYYALFGNYDLAVISEVDDFIFGYQKFNPNSEYHNERPEEVRTFNYQVYNCTLSCRKQDKEDYINSTFHEVIENEDENHFITITSFKIKNSILIGSNVNLINDIKLLIARDVNKHNAEFPNKQIKYLILDTTSWHEITLILVGNCYKHMGNMIYRLREKVHRDLYHMGKYDSIKKSLWFSQMKSRDRKGAHTDADLLNYSDANIFSTSHTYFGIKYQSLENEEKFKRLCKYLEGEESINCNVHLYTKPGFHVEAKQDYMNILFNSGDIEYISDNILYMLKHYRELIVANDNEKIQNDKNRLRKTKTIPKIKFEEHIYKFGLVSNANDSSNEKNGSINHIADYLESELPISLDDIGKINEQLCKSNVSKAVRQRALKVLNNYNDAISDRQLYIYFMDLKYFVDDLMEYIGNIEGQKEEKDYYKKTVEVNDAINQRAAWFEYAYSNRIQHSLRTIDLSEFNLDFNGGIQQIVSMYNFVFNTFRGALRYYVEDGSVTNNSKANNPSITYLTSASGVKSNDKTLQLNYFHITQPEILVVTIFKEALNFLPYKKNNKISADSMKEAFNFISIGDKEKLDAWVSRRVKEYGFSSQEQCKYETLLHYMQNYPIKSSLQLQDEILDTIHHQMSSVLPDQQDIELDVLDVLQYVDIVDHEMIHYIIADFNNFLLYFQEDTALYSYWYWLHYFQESDTYEISGRVNERLFLKAFFRYHMTYLLWINSIGKEDGYLKTKWLEPLTNNTEKKKLYHKHKDNTEYICRLLLSREFLDGVLDFKNFIKEKVFRLSAEDKFTHKDKASDMKTLYKALFTSVFDDKPDTTEKFIEKIIDSTQFDKNDTDVFLELRDIFMAYLSVLKSNFYLTNFEVERREDGLIKNSTEYTEKPEPFRIDGGSIQIDKHGGLFVTGKKRSTYFLAKNYLFKILINYSIGYKIKLFP